MYYVRFRRFRFVLTLIPAESVQQDPYVWEPLAFDEPISSVPLPAVEETGSSNGQYFEQSEFDQLGLPSMTPYAGNICARDGTTSGNGATCNWESQYWEPQCENGKLAMCCSKVTKYGRPTECTRCWSTLMNITLDEK